MDLGSEIQIHEEGAEDLEAIHALLTAAFEGCEEADLVRALRSSGRLSLSLLAELPKQVGEQARLLGQVAFSPARLAGGKRGEGLGLAPLGVSPATQGQGVGTALMEAALSWVRSTPCGWVVVLGAPAYYQRFGFEAASSRGLRDEFGGGEHFMVWECRAGALPASGGLVHYAPEFDLWKLPPEGEAQPG